MTKIKFYSQYNHPKTVPVRWDNHFITRELEFYNEDGQPYLETVEKIDIWSKTQSHKEECQIENILKAAALGDLSRLQERNASYIDVTDMPKSLMEFQNIRIRMIDEFEHMPAEVKALFDYSAEKYVNEMGSKEFFEKMSPYNKKIADIEAAGSKAAYDKKVAEAAKFNMDVKAAEGSTTE